MLRNPRVTIAPLPLYFYVPNFGGIVLSSKQLKIMQNLCAGIKHSYLLYKDKATDYQMDMWSKEFRWYFIKWAFRKVKYLDNQTDLDTARACFKELSKIGALDKAPYKWAKDLRHDICDFIKD